jgi:hypothetical protein
MVLATKCKAGQGVPWRPFHVHKNLPTDPILELLNPFYDTPYFSKIHDIIHLFTSLIFQEFPCYFLSLLQRAVMNSTHKISAHLVYKVAELSHLLVLAWQHAGDSGHHPPSSFLLSSQLYMQEVSHMPASTFNSGTLFYAYELWFICIKLASGQLTVC